MSHSQGLSSTSYPDPNQPNGSYYTYFFKVLSNIVLASPPKPS
jgi:hypothetical protein